jgi:hypothetical protein
MHGLLHVLHQLGEGVLGTLDDRMVNVVAWGEGAVLFDTLVLFEMLPSSA